MTDTVRDKLREIYNRLYSKHIAVIEQFNEQFGESCVDSDICSFDKLVDTLNNKTLGFYVSQFENSNEYGSYSINAQDYAANGKGKPFLEYIPDLGLLDFITPVIEHILDVDSNKAIIVHFPTVRVTNEFDKYIDIQDLYARVRVTPDGRLVGNFELARTTYPYKQYMARYAHSHMPKIRDLCIGEWIYPCTGIGPINDTMETLRLDYDLHIWGLFTYELAKYVTIESVAGTPYIRLEDVDKGDMDLSITSLKSRTSVPPLLRPLMHDFIMQYANKNKFRFKFVKGQYQIGNTVVPFIINLSNEFISFLNDSNFKRVMLPTLKRLKEYHILTDCVVADGVIYKTNTENRGVSVATSLNGKEVFTFKGQPVKIKILVDENTVENHSLLFTKEYCEMIISHVLSIINYKYGKRQNQNCPCPTNTSTQAQTETSEKLYIV